MAFIGAPSAIKAHPLEVRWPLLGPSSGIERREELRRARPFSLDAARAVFQAPPPERARARGWRKNCAYYESSGG